MRYCVTGMAVQNRPEYSFSNNVVLEALGYRVFHCVLDSEDRKQLDVNVITKDNMVLSLQEEVTIEFVNNDFAITR